MLPLHSLPPALLFTSAQTPPRSVWLPQTGSCRPSANQICHFLPTLFPFSSPFSSPPCFFFFSGRQGGRDSIFYFYSSVDPAFPTLSHLASIRDRSFVFPLSLGYPMHHRTASHQPSFYRPPNISLVRDTNARQRIASEDASISKQHLAQGRDLGNPHRTRAVHPACSLPPRTPVPCF